MIRLADIKLLHHIGFHRGGFYLRSAEVTDLYKLPKGKHRVCINCGAMKYQASKDND